MEHIPPNFENKIESFKQKYLAREQKSPIGIDQLIKAFEQLELAETEEEVKQAYMPITMHYFILSTDVLLDVDLADDVSEVMGQDIKLLAARYWRAA